MERKVDRRDSQVDELLLARYLEDHNSITSEEILIALRKSTIDGLAIPVYVVCFQE